MPPGNDAGSLWEWQQFVMAMVDHTEDNWPGLLAGVEVWNEPNGKIFWTLPGGPDPVLYTKVLCYAYSGVNAINSAIPVIFAGTNPGATAYPGKMSINTFVSTAYGNGAAACMDSLGIHPYPVDPTTYGVPTTLNGMVDAYVDQIANIRQLAVNAGDTGRDISVTEVNIVTNFGEQLMADFLVEAYQETEAMNDVDMFLVHTLYDVPPYAGGPVDPSGVCASPGTPQLAASALKLEITGDPTAAAC
jgi:hypothetical protein